MKSNRHRMFYPYRCRYCGREQLRGSSAKRCNLRLQTTTGHYRCNGKLVRLSDEPQTRLGITG